MNTKLLLNATLSALTASAMVHAEPAPIIAVANPKCNLVISQPDNSAGYYLNGDCKAAFVLPPKSGAAKVEAISQVGNLDMCPGLSKARVRGEKYQDQVDKLVAQLVTDTGLTTQQQTNIRDNIALISGLITSLYQPYDMVPAATIQISYTQPSIDQWVGEFLRRNPNVGADYGSM